ncbi:MAG: flagellar basal body-associated FliL family protein [Deltaproteobacteria bacterium]|jgi:flagellar FliL protein|nr:flagellar basal body-associated FliL family protein [Deltaproteobacteria bacterium]
MAAQEKERKPKNVNAEEQPSRESHPAAQAHAGSKGGGGMIKVAILVVLAMLVGGGVMFGAMKFFLAPKAADGTETRAQAETGESAARPSETPAGASEDEDPIVAPTKSGTASPEGGQGNAAPASGGETAAAAAAGPVIVRLDPFTTNLNESSGRRFLKVTMSMEVENQEAADELTRVMPDVQDTILLLLSSQTVDSISSMDGKERLRSMILNRTNAYMKEYKVKKVQYSEFVIQ